MTLKDYGYDTEKCDLSRERALTSAFSEKGANWVNTQLRDMLRVARENESIVLFKDKCNFIGSSPEEEIKKIRDEYEVILYNMVVHTKNYDFVHREFFNYAVIQIGWRNVCAWLENLKNNEKDEKVAEKIKKDMDYVIEVHSHRKKAMEKDTGDGDEKKEKKESNKIKKIMDEYEEILLNMVIHTKNYDFVHKEFLDYAVIQIGWRNLCKELENLKNNKQGVKVSEKIKKDMDYVIEVYNNEHEDKCVSSEDNHKCKCVSSEEIRTIVREELSKMFGELKKINEDIRKMYAEMIV